MKLPGKSSRLPWRNIGLGALVLVTGLVSFLAIRQHQAPVQVAVPAETPTMSNAQSPSTDPTPPPTPTTTPSTTSASPSTAPSTPASPLGDATVALAEPGASVLVLGDGSGNENDEWVRLWADELSESRSVTYNLWDRAAAAYEPPVELGSGPELTIWNGSVRGPDLEVEAERIQKAWEDADVVLLSYGHRQYPRYIADHMSAILKAIRANSGDAEVVVILQNPDPAKSAENQERVVEAISKWADEQKLPTLDVHGGFPTKQSERDILLEEDGSPNQEGSALFARLVSEALAPA